MRDFDSLPGREKFQALLMLSGFSWVIVALVGAAVWEIFHA